MLVGLSTTDAYIGTITVTPPGTVFSFSGGGAGDPICIAILTYSDGTVVTFDANPDSNPGAGWNSHFQDQISSGNADPLVTTVNANIDGFGFSICAVDCSVDGCIFYNPFP